MIQEKTHNVRQNPGMSANRLADYMAASEQTRRSILRSCKFMPRARVIQHQEAKESIARYVSSADFSDADLETRIEILRNGLHGSDFDNEVAEHNADYIERFMEKRPAQLTQISRLVAVRRITYTGISHNRSSNAVFGQGRNGSRPPVSARFS